MIIKHIKNSIQQKEAKKHSKMFSLVATQLSKTMSCLFESFFEMKQFGLAKLAAFWSLQESLKFNRDFGNVARCYANAMKIIFYVEAVDEFLWLPNASLEQTSRALFADDLNLYAFTEVIRMYEALMLFQ